MGCYKFEVVEYCTSFMHVFVFGRTPVAQFYHDVLLVVEILCLMKLLLVSRRNGLKMD